MRSQYIESRSPVRRMEKKGLSWPQKAGLGILAVATVVAVGVDARHDQQHTQALLRTEKQFSQPEMATNETEAQAIAHGESIFYYGPNEVTAYGIAEQVAKPGYTDMVSVEAYSQVPDATPGYKVVLPDSQLKPADIQK